MTLFTASVNASANDASQAAGTVDISGGALNANAATHYVGYRFTSVTIPPGSTITAATLDLEVYSGSFDDPDVTIYADDSDSAAAFVASSNNISGRTATTATTTWTDSSIGTGIKTTPDFAATVQEIIDRGGWASGNAIALITKGNSGSSALRTRAWDAGTGSPAALSITYTAPSSGGQPPRTMHQFNQRRN